MQKLSECFICPNACGYYDGVPTLRVHMVWEEIFKELPFLNGQTNSGELFDICTPLGSNLRNTESNLWVHGECILLDIYIPHGLDLDKADEQRSEAGPTDCEPALVPPPTIHCYAEFMPNSQRVFFAHLVKYSIVVFLQILTIFFKNFRLLTTPHS